MLFVNIFGIVLFIVIFKFTGAFYDTLHGALYWVATALILYYRLYLIHNYLDYLTKILN